MRATSAATHLVWVLVLTGTAPALAQSPAGEIRVVGEHQVLGSDTPESARQLALVDAHQKAWREAVARLQRRPELKSIQLTTAQIDAFVVALLETEEQPAATPQPAARSSSQVTVRARFDDAETVRRMAGLKKDQ